MKNGIVTPVTMQGPDKFTMALAKLHGAEILRKRAVELTRNRQPYIARVLAGESALMVRSVVELLASAVGLRVSAESVAKRQPSRKRARRKQTHGGSTISAPATAHPPKKNGLPVAKAWENPNLPDVNAST